MKKHILILCSFAVIVLFAACGKADDPTFEGTVKTAYFTYPNYANPTGSGFYIFSGKKKEEATSLLYSFMTDPDRKYWDAFEYSGMFHSEDEYRKLKDKFEKQCISHYLKKLEELKEEIKNEALNNAFNSASDDCVFTGQFRMNLTNISGDYDTLFVVQRPVMEFTLWGLKVGSGETDIQRIRFLDESNAQLERSAGEDRIKYRRLGTKIILYDREDLPLFTIEITTVSNFILKDAAGDFEMGEFEQLFIPLTDS